MKRLSLILLPIALGILTQPIVLAAQTNAIAENQTTEAASKRKAKWIVTGTILRMVAEKRYDLAQNLANQGVSKYPDFPPFHLARGIALFESGNLEEARPNFEKAKQLYQEQAPRVPESEKESYANGLHGTYLYLAKYDLPNPKVSFSLNPEVTEKDLNAIAQLSIKAQRYDLVEQVTSYAMQKYPNLAAPYFQRAIARHHLGRFEDAKTDFEEAKKRYRKRLEMAKTKEEKSKTQEILDKINIFLAKN
jgi:tetratricopeptide (TPR) repeat protein